jgi:site-specific recombinase XerD
MNSVNPQQQPKLLDQLRASIRYRHYSLRTEQAYVHWVKRFIFFHSKRHPKEMGGPEVEAFLSHLANDGKVAVSTHQQALSALLFLYREVLKQDLPWMTDMGRPKTPKRLPVVLTETEVRRVLDRINDQTHQLMSRLLYGTGCV